MLYKSITITCMSIDVQADAASAIVHLGLGNFHRAHQAVYTSAANATTGSEWSIIGVASRSRSVVRAMHAQQFLYNVAEISPGSTELSVPGVHRDAFVAAADPERVTASIADANVSIVTMTVTEHGYSYSPATGRLDLADPGIIRDLQNGAPSTTIGQLARGLQRRASGGGAPLSILSCDNLAENGAHTERLVREFIQELPSAEREEVLTYLDRSVSFPSSMVDRIVPSTTPELRSRVARLGGWRDEIPVPAEPFSMWAIEDRFLAGRPAWERGGAVFTPEVDRYEQMKVRLLNGTHSLIAYVGALHGAETISGSIEIPEIEAAARTILREEYEPSVTLPSEVHARDYERQLFERWSNSALGHRTAQVGTDGSVKLRQRIPEAAQLILGQGRVPHFIALTLASYLCCIAPRADFDPGRPAASMVDPARELLAPISASAQSGHDLALGAIERLQLFGQDLAHQTTLVSRVGELIDIIERHGVSAATRDCLTASLHERSATRKAHR